MQEEKVTNNEPKAAHPASAKPTVKQKAPVTEHPAAGASPSVQPPAEQKAPAAERPVVDPSSAAQPPAEQKAPAAERPATDLSPVTQSAPDQKTPAVKHKGSQSEQKLQKAEHRERQVKSKNRPYVLPLIGGVIIGFLVGRFTGLGELPGVFVGALAIDLFFGLPGAHRLAAEMRQMLEALTGLRSGK